MPKRPSTSSLVVYHVFNRSASKRTIFEGPNDYLSFLQILAATAARVPIRLLSYCIMPNHWHLVVWPVTDGSLSRFMHLLTMAHAKEWLISRDLQGAGHVYQGRFKAIPVQHETHLLTLLRYVERNPVRAGLVNSAADWPWSRLGQRRGKCPELPLTEWPVARPSDWLTLVNTPQTMAEETALRQSLKRGAPFGDLQWAELRLEHWAWRARCVEAGLESSCSVQMPEPPVLSWGFPSGFSSRTSLLALRG
jgi:putative transposase